jgi:hypothetical protein
MNLSSYFSQTLQDGLLALNRKEFGEVKKPNVIAIRVEIRNSRSLREKSIFIEPRAFLLGDVKIISLNRSSFESSGSV